MSLNPGMYFVTTLTVIKTFLILYNDKIASEYVGDCYF